MQKSAATRLSQLTLDHAPKTDCVPTAAVGVRTAGPSACWQSVDHDRHLWGLGQDENGQVLDIQVWEHTVLHPGAWQYNALTVRC